MVTVGSTKDEKTILVFGFWTFAWTWTLKEDEDRMMSWGNWNLPDNLMSPIWPITSLDQSFRLTQPSDLVQRFWSIYHLINLECELLNLFSYLLATMENRRKPAY